MASFKQIKFFVESKGVRGLLEKDEFLRSYRQLLDGGRTVHSYDRKFGELNALVRTNSASPKVAVCVLHGFGANMENLSPFSDVCERVIGASAEWVCIIPNGGLDLGGGSRAWWMIDLQRLQAKIMNLQFSEITKDVPAGLDVARSRVLDLMQEASTAYSLPPDAWSVCGFSQGGMLTGDLLVHMEPPPNVAGLFSAALICEDLWTEQISKKPLEARERLKKCAIVQSHGTTDMVVPVIAGHWMRDYWQKQGLKVDFDQFNGPHAVGPGAVDKFFAKVLEADRAKTR